MKDIAVEVILEPLEVKAEAGEKVYTDTPIPKKGEEMNSSVYLAELQSIQLYDFINTMQEQFDFENAVTVITSMESGFTYIIKGDPFKSGSKLFEQDIWKWVWTFGYVDGVISIVTCNRDTMEKAGRFKKETRAKEEAKEEKKGEKKFKFYNGGICVKEGDLTEYHKVVKVTKCYVTVRHIDTGREYRVKIRTSSTGVQYIESKDLGGKYYAY